MHSKRNPNVATLYKNAVLPSPRNDGVADLEKTEPIHYEHISRT
jgi:hypothetical protein